MRRRNWRVVVVGFVLIIVAVAFFVGMMTVAPQSNDPATVMRTVGQVAGAISGLSIVMIIFGLIGKKQA
jgi:hypothetical protein